MRLRLAGIDDFVRRYREIPALRGLFVATRTQVPVGTLVDLSLELTTGRGLRVLGEVVWTRGPELDREAGVGVRFVDMDEASRAWLATVLPETIPGAAARPQPAATPTPAAAVAHPALGKGADEEWVVGIDLGTSNTCACVISGGKPVVIDLSDTELFGSSGTRTLPSVVSYDDEGRVLVGARAAYGLRSNPKRTIFGSKRLIGRTYDSPVVQAMLSRFPFHVVPDNRRRAAVEIGGKPMALTTISGEILRTVKARAEQQLRRPIHDAVITVPAYYNDNQRAAVVEAGRIAGFNVRRILNEPTAAAIAYGVRGAEPRRFLVFDLGGGTFDVSVMQVDQGTLTVLSTAGDTFLGGEDFDNAIVQWVYDQIARTAGKPLSQNHAPRALIKAAAEKAKTRLSVHDATTVTVRDALLADGSTTRIELQLSRATLESLVAPLIDRALALAEQALGAAAVASTDLDEVILVGGQTRMPLVQQRVAAFFKKPPRVDLNPDEVVAQGAALLPHLSQHGGVPFRDVLSMSIGYADGGKLHPVLKRNEAVPCERSFTLEIPAERLATFSLDVWQGDESEVQRNENLGLLKLDALTLGKPTSRSEPRVVAVRVTFALSADCLLSCEVENLATGETRDVLLVARGRGGT